jgi:hypothetical protein
MTTNDGVYLSSNIHLVIYSLSIALLLSVRWHFLPRSPRQRASTGFVGVHFYPRCLGLRIDLSQVGACCKHDTTMILSKTVASEMKHKRVPQKLAVETAVLFAHLECMERGCSVTTITRFSCSLDPQVMLRNHGIIDHRLISSAALNASAKGES